MKFIERIEALKSTYTDIQRGVRDRALLLGVFKHTPPLAEHMLFLPMPKEVQEELVARYRREFPEQLLEVYGYMNGANLFWSSKKVGKFQIPFQYLSVYGVPLSYDRKQIEPFNISIEDLNRPDGTPDAWLKFGSYITPDDKSKRWDLFADTETGQVYSVENRSPSCEVKERWNSIDECLCSLFDMLLACKEQIEPDNAFHRGK